MRRRLPNSMVAPLFGAADPADRDQRFARRGRGQYDETHRCDLRGSRGHSCARGSCVGRLLFSFCVGFGSRRAATCVCVVNRTCDDGQNPVALRDWSGTSRLCRKTRFQTQSPAGSRLAPLRKTHARTIFFTMARTARRPARPGGAASAPPRAPRGTTKRRTRAQRVSADFVRPPAQRKFRGARGAVDGFGKSNRLREGPVWKSNFGRPTPRASSPRDG